MTRILASLRGACIAAAIPAATASAGTDQYTMTNLGAPPGAYITTAVRMNNLGQVAGYSLYIGQGEPSIKPWVWTAKTGYTILPPPPNMFQGRARAMDISDSGIIAGDGGFDAGIAWRYVDGQYETFGQVGGMSIAYLGAINEAGDVVGTAKDAQITTEDEVFIDLMDGGTLHLTPGPEGGRGVDINNAGQICGYSQGSGTGFGAFLWDESDGFLFLGTAGLAYSFANDMNDLGQVVGSAQSASGNTVNNWIFTPGAGQQVLDVPGPGSAAAINNLGAVVGTRTCCGPDDPWIWTPQAGARDLFDLFNYVAAGLSGPSSRDINDVGQILLNAYDNNAGEYRPILLTPVANGTGACCLEGSNCLGGITEEECGAQSGVYQGNGALCAACVPVGACCLGNGDCLSFVSAANCAAQVGTYQGDDTSCALVTCSNGVINDDCSDAIAIGAGDTLYSTVGATTDGPIQANACGGSFTFGQDIWYLYQPEGTGTLTVSTCNQADYDTMLGAYAGDCGNLQFVACNDDACPGLTSIMNVSVSCGEPLLIRVGGFSTSSGIGTLSLSFSGSPCSTCAGDTNGDQLVDVTDLINVIGAWGTSGAGSGFDADLNDDGTVDVADLIAVINAWGSCE